MATGESTAGGEMTPTPLTPADVARIVEERLSTPPVSEGWIGALTREQAIAECERRGLEISGIVPVLRERLRRHERAARGTRDRFLDPYGGMSEEEGIRRLSRITLSARADAEEDRSAAPSRGQNGAVRRLLTPERDLRLGAEDRGARSRSAERRAGSPPRRATGDPRSASEALKWLRQWSVSFAGARGADAEAFLERIREGRELTAVGDRDLLGCLPFVLSDIALIWFRAKRADWATWAEFERAFRSRFAAPDFQWELHKEILLRTQGEGEPVADYLACILGLFARLQPPWPLAQQLGCAHGNLLPKYQLAVRRGDVHDWGTLEALAAEAEVRFTAYKRYRPPPSPEGSLLPSLACRTPARSTRKRTTIGAAAAIEDEWPIEREPPEDAPEATDGEERVTAAVEPSAGARKPRDREAGSGKARREPRRSETPERRRPRESRRDVSTERVKRRDTDRGEGRRGGRGNRDGARSPPRGVRGTCWRCDQPGHFARECTQPPRSGCCAGCTCQEVAAPVPAEGAGNAPGRA